MKSLTSFVILISIMISVVVQLFTCDSWFFCNWDFVVTEVQIHP